MAKKDTKKADEAAAVPEKDDGNVVLEGFGSTTVPKEQAHNFQITVGNRVYTHVGEDAKGRWIYRLA